MAAKNKKVEAGSVGLAAGELTAEDAPAHVSQLADHVTEAGGSVLARYREPFGGHWVVLAALPVDRIAPTPFQRELSDAHAKRLEAVIPKVERFLDPVVAVRADDGFWTPNGMHRLEAMNRLGAKSIVALIVPEFEIAYRILALNTEKAHNLKDKSLEVVRMVDALAADAEKGALPETHWEFEFEEASYLTVGRCYQQKARFSGSAYLTVVKRCEKFLDMPLADTVDMRKRRADKLLVLDKAVADCVKQLKERGLDSSYLKPFVVARINPLRFVRAKRGDGPADFDATFDAMIDKAENFDVEKIEEQDVAKAAG